MNEVLEGMTGEPLPYLLHTDWMVTTILFLCIMVLSFVLSKEKKYLLQQLKLSFTSRKRSSMFDETIPPNVHYKSVLIAHSCLMLGFCFYHYYVNIQPTLLEKIPHGWLLAGYTACVGIFVLFKYILYEFINWVFFQKERNMLWIASFFNLFIWFGVVLLPIVLLTVYFDISLHISLILIGILIIFAKISLFWMCFSNFFEKIHGAFHLILYFCALEILPDLLFWKGMELANNNLILNL